MNSLSRRFGFAIASLLSLTLGIGGSITGSRWARSDEPAADAPVTSPSPTPSAEPTPSPTQTPSSDAVPSRWSGNNGGVFWGYSPLYLPQLATSDRFNTGNVPTFQAGVELKDHGKISFRYSKTTVPSLEVYDPTTFVTTYSPDASLKIFDLLVGFDIPVNQPYGKLGPFQFFLPVSFGTALVLVDGGAYSFKAASFDSSFGVGAHVYTKSFIRADLSALYHFGIPLTSFTGGSSSSSGANVLDPAGETMKAGLSGFEMYLGLTFIFPDSPPSDAPAADASRENK
jgi:hypothetical protein